MTSLKPSLDTLNPGLKMRENLCFLCGNFLYPTILCSGSGARLQNRANFTTLIVGLAWTGDHTRATCVAGSGNNRSAIHFVIGAYNDEIW
jgi:hypothetical protein